MNGLVESRKPNQTEQLNNKKNDWTMANKP